MSNQISAAQPGDMFAAFLNAYERGRELARARQAAGAMALHPDTTPAVAVPEKVDHTITLDELIEGLPEPDAFHHGAGAAHILWGFANGLLHRPPEERRAIIDHARPDLMKIGLGGRQIDAFDPTNRNLERVAARLTPLIETHRRLHPGEFVSPPGQDEPPRARETGETA